MRGQKALFDDLFEDKKGSSNSGLQPTRKDSMQNRRNELLCARYLYHKNHIPGARAYEQIVLKMEDEFFLKSTQIIRLLERNTDLLVAYRKKNLSKAELLKMWPHWRW